MTREAGAAGGERTTRMSEKGSGGLEQPLGAPGGWRPERRGEEGDVLYCWVVNTSERHALQICLHVCAPL